MLKKLPLLFTVAFACPMSYAQSTWTGATSTDWTDGSNWSAGTPTSSETGVLSGTPTANLPDIGSGATIRTLEIQSAGWTINSTGGTGNLGFIPASGNDPNNELNVTGGGLTVINGNVTAPAGYNAPDMNAVNGSKLVINGNLTNPTGRSWQIRGDGYYVFNGDVPNNADLSPRLTEATFGSYIFNNNNGPIVVSKYADFAISSGNVFGGTLSTLRIYQYQVMAMESGSRFIIGGDGSTIVDDGYYGGDAISTMTIQSSSSSIRAGLNMESGSQLEMDILSTSEYDQIILGALDSDFNIASGVTLALSGPDSPVGGTYTLLSETVVGSDYTGQFDTVTYNGSALDPEIFTLSYDASEINLSIVPEPSVYAGLMGLAVLGLVFIRRR